MPDRDAIVSRRAAMGAGVRAAALLAAGGALGALASRAPARSQTRWQIDPWACTWCGQCATECVLAQSAVKCTQVFPLCGYCRLCTGFFDAQPHALDSGAENQLCPTNAIVRRHVEGQYYEYTINESACIGCGKCVKGCTLYGNGSFFLQINHALCVNCNQCTIASKCPSRAIGRVDREHPYLLKTTTSKPT